MPRHPESPSSPQPPHGAHWVVTGVSSQSEPCLQVLSWLNDDQRPPPDGLPRWPALPHLRSLLGMLSEVGRLGGDEYALSMPHERLLAQAWGWPDADGQVPWAAWWATQDGLSLAAGQAWALLSPGHWLMGRDHLTVVEPSGLQLSNDDSQALLATVRPFFEDDGWTLIWGSALRWYASHPSLASYPSASLDRVSGRNPDLWLTDHPHAKGVRRLQSEVQMLLYQHPVNEAREARGQLSINSFWLSGAGLISPGHEAAPAQPHLAEVLKPPLLRDDMVSWLEAWAELDRTLLAELAGRAAAGEPVWLTLCGERHAVTLGPGQPSPPPGWWSRLRQVWSPKGPAAPQPGTWLAEL